jgi:dipeptidyl aminopeptidase/acylaminoacyl peptidase
MVGPTFLRVRAQSRTLHRGIVRLVCIALFLVPAPMCAAEGKPAVTVADSIRMTRLVDPDLRATGFRSLDVKRSPDGSRFVVVTTRGDLTRGCNEFQLLLFDFAAVEATINGAPLPHPVTLATFCTSSNHAGITKVKWMTSGEIAFLGEIPGEHSQLYTIDIAKKKLARLTNHPTSVIDFDLNAGDRFVYMALTDDDWSYRKTHGYVVGTQPFLDVVSEGALEVFRPATFYIGYRSGRAPKPIDETPYQLGIQEPLGISLSPSGRWAVVFRHVDNAPKSWWTDYPVVAARSYYSGINDAGARDFSSPGTALFKQFALVDLNTGKSTPILDAPSGHYLGGIVANAIWEKGERSLLLANTLLPIDNTVPLAERSLWPAVIELDVASKKFSKIAEIKPEAFAGTIPKGLFLGAKLAPDGSLLLGYRGADDWHDITDRYVRSDKGWNKVDTGPSNPKVRIAIAQDSNTWPQLVATDSDTGKHATITNFNPQLADLELGHLETVSWTDAYGHNWVGGLIKPVGYEPGHRYPLVIQTHGYRPGEFFVDGHLDFTSGYAAREMANRGIAVIQIDDTGDWDGTREKLVKLVRPYESAVAMLDKAGLIDPDRVGIHGFSAYGIHVEQILTNTNLKIAAASVADASEYSLMNSVMWYGMPYPAMMADERIVGTTLWGDQNVVRWAQQDPTFHLDRISSPLLIEDNQTSFPWFDIFARLKRHHRPVEFISLPGGDHVLFQPWQRLTAQEAVADWYDFWLNGHEDAGSAKRAQYARWEQLCALQKSANPQQTPRCIASNAH